MKQTYNNRIKEEVEKFCAVNDVDYEKAEIFTEWVIFYAGQQIKKELRGLVNTVLD